MKKFISGLLVGAILMCAIPTFAKVISYTLTKSNYTINVNGEEYKSDSFPLMSYNNVTYIPTTAFDNIVKNESKKQINISTSKVIPLKIGETYTKGDFSIILKEVRTNELSYTKLREKILIFEINSPGSIIYPNIVSDDIKFGLLNLKDNLYSCIYNSYVEYNNPYIEIDGIKLTWDIEL